MGLQEWMKRHASTHDVVLVDVAPVVFLYKTSSKGPFHNRSKCLVATGNLQHIWDICTGRIYEEDRQSWSRPALLDLERIAHACVHLCCACMCSLRALYSCVAINRFSSDMDSNNHCCAHVWFLWRHWNCMSCLIQHSLTQTSVSQVTMIGDVQASHSVTLESLHVDEFSHHD